MGLFDSLLGGPHRVFVLDDEKFQPTGYGELVAKLASLSSPQRAKQLIELGKHHGTADTLFARVNAQPVYAQMHLVSLDCASQLLQAASLPGVTNEVRDEVVAGMLSVFQASVGKLAPVLMSMVFEYFSALRAEWSEEDIGFNVDGCSTAKLAFDNMVEMYQSFAPLSGLGPVEVELMDAILIKHFMTAMVIGVFKARDEMKLRYVS